MPQPSGKAGFEALLKSKNVAATTGEPEFPENWGEIQRDEWLRNLTALYKQIEAALEKYVIEKQVSINYRPFTLVEESIGEYSANKMIVKFVQREIVFEPVGTMLIGAKGRVDVIGPFGKTPIMLLNSKARRLSDMIKITVSIGGMPPPALTPQTKPDAVTWEWRIVSTSPSRELIPLNDEVILGLLLEMANG